MTNTEEWLRELAGEPTHEPDLTPDEWVAIRDEIREHTFGDPSLLPDCLVEAVKVLGEIGTSNTPNPARAATQCLRRLLYRATTGIPFGEIEEPAWSLDSDRAFECDCYPGGFSPDSYEGPQHHCHIHGHGTDLPISECPQCQADRQSLDPDPRPYERVLSDDVEPGDLG